MSILIIFPLTYTSAAYAGYINTEIMNIREDRPFVHFFWSLSVLLRFKDSD